jgi:WD40 repeat protein
MPFVVVGDETGLLKLVDSDTGVIKSYSEQNRQRAVVQVLLEEDTDYIRCVRANGVIERWIFDEIVSSLDLRESIVTFIEPICSVQVDNGTVVCGRDGNCAFVKDFETDISSFNVPSPIGACASSSSLPHQVLFGGKERELLLYDITQQAPVWEARNVQHDQLDLRVPVWITAIDVWDANTFVIGTAHKHVRIYDSRESRRPIRSFDLEDDFRVSSLKIAGNGDLSVADTSGNQFLYDFKTLKKIRAFRGATGSIRALQSTFTHEGLTLLSGGLDRHLRLYHIDRSDAYRSFYMKNRINSLVVFSSNNEVHSDDEEVDSTQDKLEVVSDDYNSSDDD